MTNDILDLAARVGRALEAKGLLLATAESCSGGGVSYAITEIAGSSEWFDAGFVTYSNASKTEMLDVSAALIAQFGSVSEEVAGAMAEGAVANSNAHVAVSTTGIAGPTGAVPGKPVGTVCFGWSKGDATHTERLVFTGDRHAVREQTVAHALTGLLRFLGIRMPAPARRVVLAALAAALACAPAARADAGATGVTVYAAGDIARCPYHDAAYSGAADTAATIAAGLAQDPRAVVLAIGDLTYPRGTAQEFRDCYEPTWGRFKDRTWPAPGNHEYYTPGARPYFDYFGARAGRGWYSLDLGAWHVISLDSNLAPAEHAAQIDWLRTNLAAHPARCTLAFWHHPLYSSGGHGSIPTMRDAWRLLYDAGAELVLSGHDHDYERFAPQDADGHVDAARGIRQFVVGTGGAYPTPFLLFAAHSEARDASRQGVLRLRLFDGGYDWEFLESNKVTTLGTAPPDRGSGTCH